MSITYLLHNPDNQGITPFSLILAYHLLWCFRCFFFFPLFLKPPDFDQVNRCYQKMLICQCLTIEWAIAVGLAGGRGQYQLAPGPPAQERSLECCKKKRGVSYLIVCLLATEVLSVLRVVMLGKAEVHWFLMGKCILKILNCLLYFVSVWRKCQAVI